MANTKITDKNYRYAMVDTAPGAEGFYTDVVSPRAERISRFFFSIRPASDAVPNVKVTLQYKCKGDTRWSTHLMNGTDDWPVGTRVHVNDFASGVRWRAGVLSNSDYSVGAVVFGFDW